MLAELAQTQTWNRLVQLASPMMQVLAPRRRLDIPPDMALFGREIDREMPEVRRVIDDLYAELAQERIERLLGEPVTPRPYPRIEDGAHTMAFIEACLASQREGRWVGVAGA